MAACEKWLMAKIIALALLAILAAGCRHHYHGGGYSGYHGTSYSARSGGGYLSGFSGGYHGGGRR